MLTLEIYERGIFVLKKIGASELAIRGFAAHPLLQSNEDLSSVWKNKPAWLQEMDTSVLLLAMEYRKTANFYLSEHLDQRSIELSPIKEVNDMLIADKVQNRKDFEKHHLGSHPRSKELDKYFRQWLEKLGISEDKYHSLVKEILRKTGQK